MQPLLLTLDEGYLLTAALPDLQRGRAPLGPPAPKHPRLLGCGVAIANIRWIMEKAREFQKNIYFCFIDYAKAFDCVDHNKLWKILKEEYQTT